MVRSPADFGSFIGAAISGCGMVISPLLVSEHMIERRFHRRLRTCQGERGRFVDNPADFFINSCEFRSLRPSGLNRLFAKPLDAVTGFPQRNFFFASIGGSGIADVVTEGTIGQALHKRWTLSLPRALNGFV